ncbi:MAG: tellurite resistance methyltransferase TehB [Aeromonadales bacterium]|nr:tellurite resistance methyltransferase TehB [Aeromonadales bacterium]
MSVDLNSRYGLNPAHSEVVVACKLVKPGSALDMGCSNGRNALYLSQQGFNVTAVDSNPNAIAMLQDIIKQEGLTNLQAQVYDINNANLSADYDFIACTVTLMFLQPARVNAVIKDMQAHTVVGGYNLIVCAMHTAEHPCPMNFPFTLDTGELSQMYSGWELIKYNEDLGTMHNGAQLQFATLLARKLA